MEEIRKYPVGIKPSLRYEKKTMCMWIKLSILWIS